MSWVIVTATVMMFVVGVICSPIDVPQPATDLLPPVVDSGPTLATDLMPPPMSAEMPENNWPATDPAPPALPEEKMHDDGKNIADTAEEKIQEVTQQPQFVDSGMLMRIRRKRHSKYKKHSYGGGCKSGCGGGYYYQPRPVYYKVIVVQPVQKQYYHPQRTCNTCGGGYGGHGGGGSYAQASAQASAYSYGR